MSQNGDAGLSEHTMDQYIAEQILAQYESNQTYSRLDDVGDNGCCGCLFFIGVLYVLWVTGFDALIVAAEYWSKELHALFPYLPQAKAVFGISALASLLFALGSYLLIFFGGVKYPPGPQAVKVHWSTHVLWLIAPLMPTISLALVGFCTYRLWCHSFVHAFGSTAGTLLFIAGTCLFILFTVCFNAWLGFVLRRCMSNLPSCALAITYTPEGQKRIVEIIEIVDPVTVRVRMVDSIEPHIDTVDCRISSVFNPGLEDADELAEFQRKWEHHYAAEIHDIVDQALTAEVENCPLLYRSKEVLAETLITDARTLAHQMRRNRIMELRGLIKSRVDEVAETYNDLRRTSIHIDLSQFNLPPLDTVFRTEWQLVCRNMREEMEIQRMTLVRRCLTRCGRSVDYLEMIRARWSGDRHLSPVFPDLKEHLSAEINGIVEPCKVMLKQSDDPTIPDNTDLLLAHVKPILNRLPVPSDGFSVDDDTFFIGH